MEFEAPRIRRKEFVEQPSTAVAVNSAAHMQRAMKTEVGVFGAIQATLWSFAEMVGLLSKFTPVYSHYG